MTITIVSSDHHGQRVVASETEVIREGDAYIDVTVEEPPIAPTATALAHALLQITDPPRARRVKADRSTPTGHSRSVAVHEPSHARRARPEEDP